MPAAQRSERPSERQRLQRRGSSHGAKKARKPQPPLRAFVVQEDYEGTGDVFYARHDIVARKAFAEEFNDAELRGVTCQRAPWADKYAPGPCPRLVMIDNGWWMDCAGCGLRITHDADGDSEDQVRPDKAVEVGTFVYCSPGCRHRHLQEKTLRKIHGLRAIHQLRAKLFRLAPGVTLLGKDHAYVVREGRRWIAKQVIVRFTFPGATINNGEIRFDKAGDEPRLTVPAGDLMAWQAWRKQAGASSR
jgi:hypothetical protein